MAGKNIVPGDDRFIGRVWPSDQLLTQMVQEEIARRSLQGEEFTFYSITKALRKNNPQIDVEHMRVRPIAEAIIASYPHYVVRDVATFPDGQQARIWGPDPTVTVLEVREVQDLTDDQGRPGERHSKSLLPGIDSVG